MTALDACPCGTADTHTTPGDFPARFCAGCGAFASRCAEPGCETFADHQTDDGLGWCAWHCPDAKCVEGRAPKRIQLRRTKGWRKPGGAIVVARPTQWGNPFKAGRPATPTVADAVDLYRFALSTGCDPWFDGLRSRLPELRGHDLACWCPLDQPCHADVLLELANA